VKFKSLDVLNKVARPAGMSHLVGWDASLISNGWMNLETVCGLPLA